MLKADWKKYTLDFIRQSRTSRDILDVKDTYFIRVQDTAHPGISGYGEAALFRGLSADDTPGFVDLLNDCCNSVNNIDISTIPSSAIRMGFETAFADLHGGGTGQPFYTGRLPFIRINGLIWMGSKEFMINEIEYKLQQGFHCLKLKIGGIDFENELEILHGIRERYSSDRLELRLDANGAFSVEDALDRLVRLSHFDIHSIEQPIKAGQTDEMAEICRSSPIPIALDEELIGITPIDQKRQIVETIRPDYLILKPTLCGGFAESDEWIKVATEYGIGWWATSALESNVGLNAIARWTSSHNVTMPQGLGTGQLYSNNIPSPLQLQGEYLTSNDDNAWNYHAIKF